MTRGEAMKAMVLPALGAALRLETVPVPKIGLGDVLLRVRATGVGLTVVLMTAVPGRVTSFPRIPGHEVAGEVVEVGAEVTHDMLEIHGSHYVTLAEIQQTLELLRQGRIRAVVTRTFPLDGAEEAHDLLRKNALVGRAALLQAG